MAVVVLSVLGIMGVLTEQLLMSDGDDSRNYTKGENVL